jgi:mono/diheme cytochrome c family protein
MRRHLLGLVGLSLIATGCHTDMWVQPRQDALEESDFFADGQSARPLVPGTIARDHLREDAPFYTGAKDGKWLTELPVKVDMDLLTRGKDRYRAFCTPCHGQTGDGKGMIAQRGFTLRRPVGNFHTDRLRKLPVGHYYDVITNGYGAMYSYASRVEPRDRWAIVAYIRALQLSQKAPVSVLSAAELDELRNPKPKAETSEKAHDGAH